MQNLLFIELLGGIGDLLIALPAIQAIGRSYPNAKLTVLTFAPGAELLKHDPLIHQVIAIAPQPNSHSQSIRQTVESYLEQHSFDLIVSDTNYDEIDRVIQKSGATQVVTNLWRSPPSNQRVSDRFMQILLAEGVIQTDTIAAPQLHLTLTESDKAQRKLGDISRPLIVLVPDAGMVIKRWSTANFVTVGRALQQQYGATIIVPIGSDFQSAVEIVNAIGGTVRLWERGTLRELAAVLALADLAIASDTGPIRIAAALNTPTITLFGPAWGGRYGQPSPHINLQGYPNCPERNIGNFTLQPCWYSGQCPFNGWQTYLEEISSEDVLSAATKLLETPVSIPQPSTFDLASRPFNPSSPPTLHTPPPALSPQWSSAQNILVIRLDNMGDVLMIAPALRAIKETLPQSCITLMASPSGSQAAELLPWVDDILTVRSLWQDLGKLEFEPAREWELIQTVRDRQSTTWNA